MFGKNKKSDQNINKPLGIYSVKHVLGLEIPQITCKVAVYNDRISITSGANEYEISISKLFSIDFEMNIDTERYLKSNMSRGIAGAMAFGVSGAVVGSSPTSKVKRNITSCATVCYQASNGEIAYIVLEDTAPNTKEAAKFTDKVRPLIKQGQIRNKIEL